MAKSIGQAVFFVLFMLGIGFFATRPTYHYLDSQQALMRLSISHAGEIVGTCRERSAAELTKMSRNMRALQDCPRERSPVTIALELDGQELYHEVIPPSGLSHDGASTVYRRFPLQSGEHHLTVRINDSKKVSGFNYERSELVQLHPSQVLVVDFNRQQGGVIIK